jgi:CHAT domain-containing protein
MSEEVNDEGYLRNYLLGELPEAAQQTLEDRLMTETELFDLLQVVEDELVDEYLSGAFSAGERSKFESLFLSTPERRRKLSFAMALKRYVTTERTRKGRQLLSAKNSSRGIVHSSASWGQALSGPYFRLGAVALVVLCLGLGIWRIFLNEPKVRSGIASLREAYRDQRPTEARITEWNYAPSPPITRGGEPERFDYVARDRAAALIHQEVEQSPSAKSFHDLGRFYLANHEFDKAIEQFDKALSLDQRDARIESDLGAALMEKGKAERRRAELLGDKSSESLEGFARSLEHLSKAIELDKSLLAPVFNRALLYQYMALPNKAEEDWRTYLERDLDSKWAAEARENLRMLGEQKQKKSEIRERTINDFIDAQARGDSDKAWDTFRRSRTRTSNLLVESLLKDYILFRGQGRVDDADERLRLLSYAGRLESNRVGDRHTYDQARFYGAVPANLHEKVVKAHGLIALGQERANQSKLDEALVNYSEAKEIFEHLGGGSEAAYLSYKIGLCYLRKAEIPKGLSLLRQLAERCELAGYKCLLARVHNSLADAHESLSEYSISIDHCVESLELCKQIEDISGEARGLVQFAILYQGLGDHRRSLNYLQRCLDVAKAEALDPTQLWVIYDVSAEVCTSLNLYAAGLSYQEEAMVVAREMGVPLNLSRCYSHLGVIYGRLNNPEEAIRNAHAAYTIGEELSDESVGKDMMAVAALKLAHFYRQAGDYDQANSFYDKNLELYDELNVQAERYEAHKGKLYCYLAQGQDALAEAELKITLKLIEDYRSKIVEDNNRNEFFDSEQDLYDLAIDFAYSKKDDPLTAFDYSEASRARSLLDLDNPGSSVIVRADAPDLRLPFVSQPLKLAEIQQQMPGDVQIIQYAVVARKIIIWVVSKAGVATAAQNIDTNEVVEKVDAYRQAVVQRSVGNGSRQAKELYDHLIRPVESSLNKKKLICIVPDKALNYIPFEALVSSASGNYLAQDFVVETCPSSTIFVRCSKTAGKKGGTRTERILSIGAPSFDTNMFSKLDELPSSATEAKEIADLYSPALVLTGDKVRESEVKAEIPKSDVVHLATHFVADEGSPLLSKLLLTKEEFGPGEGQKSDGLLQAYEIYAMRLPRTRLVVLSACQTGIEHSYKGEGAIGIARSFIKAGAPLVVASVWPVETQATLELMIKFHRFRKLTDLSTAEALRRAQLEMINHPDRRLRQPYYWAGFVLIGGYASF